MTTFKFIAEVEKEEEIITANKKLIELMENKISEVLKKIYERGIDKENC